MTIGVPSDDDLYSATPPRKGRIDVQAEDDLSIVQKVDQIPKLGRIKDRKAWVYELTLKGIPHRIFGSHIEKGKKYYRWRKRVSNSWKVVFEGEIKASRLTKEIQEEVLETQPRIDVIISMLISCKVDAYLISQHS